MTNEINSPFKGTGWCAVDNLSSGWRITDYQDVIKLLKLIQRAIVGWTPGPFPPRFLSVGSAEARQLAFLMLLVFTVLNMEFGWGPWRLQGVGIISDAGKRGVPC